MYFGAVVSAASRQITAGTFFAIGGSNPQCALFRALKVMYPFFKCNNVPILGNGQGTLIDILQ